MQQGKLNFRRHTVSKPLAEVGFTCKKAPVTDAMFRGIIKCIPHN
jgi:hypothetical protein